MALGPPGEGRGIQREKGSEGGRKKKRREDRERGSKWERENMREERDRLGRSQERGERWGGERQRAHQGREILRASAGVHRMEEKKGVKEEKEGEGREGTGPEVATLRGLQRLQGTKK